MTSSLDPSNKGFQMMAKLGFKPGEALGKRKPSATETNPETNTGTGIGTDSNKEARTEPLNLTFKEDRGGIGLDSEKKRKIREEADEAVKKVKQDEGDYRDRVRIERETRRTEVQVHAAQKVAERLDIEAEDNEDNKNNQDQDEEGKSREKGTEKKNAKPTSTLPVLYRGVVREREEKDRSLYTRHHLQTSLPSSFFPNPRLPSYSDPTLDREDREALDQPPSPSPPLQDEEEKRTTSMLEQEVYEEDPELDEFNALEPGERLQRVVIYLRERHWYCFWCKCRYETEEMEGCPGITEEDHD